MQMSAYRPLPRPSCAAPTKYPPPQGTGSKPVSRRPPALPWPLRAGSAAVGGAQCGLPCSPAASMGQERWVALGGRLLGMPAGAGRRCNPLRPAGGGSPLTCWPADGAAPPSTRAGAGRRSARHTGRSRGSASACTPAPLGRPAPAGGPPRRSSGACMSGVTAVVSAEANAEHSRARRTSSVACAHMQPGTPVPSSCTHTEGHSLSVALAANGGGVAAAAAVPFQLFLRRRPHVGDRTALARQYAQPAGQARRG